MRRELLRAALMTAFVWSFMLLAVGLGHLAIAFDGIELFILAGIGFFGSTVLAVFWAIGLAGHLMPTVMLMLWSYRDGDLGPWSGRSTKLAVFAVVLLALACGTAAFSLTSGMLLPDYSAGWR